MAADWIHDSSLLDVVEALPVPHDRFSDWLNVHPEVDAGFLKIKSRGTRMILCIEEERIQDV